METNGQNAGKSIVYYVSGHGFGHATRGSNLKFEIFKNF